MFYCINDKNCSLSIVLTAMDQKLQKSGDIAHHQSITSSKCQPDAE